MAGRVSAMTGGARSESGTLSHAAARRLYDRFGHKQDWQRFYENPALDDLIAHCSFQDAAAVAELGCGTGHLAERLLTDYLVGTATYLAIDISSTMVGLCRRRLARFGDRVCVLLTDGNPRIDEGPESCDRFVSTYVLDLLSPADIEAVIAEAGRLLVPGGLLGLVGLTHGATFPARLVERVWVGVHRVRPSWVGGCRPLSVVRFLDRGWDIVHRAVVTRFAISSEVVVAAKPVEPAAWA